MASNHSQPPAIIPNNIGELIEITDDVMCLLAVDPGTSVITSLLVPLAPEKRGDFIRLLKVNYNRNNPAHVLFAQEQGLVMVQIQNFFLAGASAFVQGVFKALDRGFDHGHDRSSHLGNGKLRNSALRNLVSSTMTCYSGYRDLQLEHTGLAVFGIPSGFEATGTNLVATTPRTELNGLIVYQHATVLENYAVIFGDSKFRPLLYLMLRFVSYISNHSNLVLR